MLTSETPAADALATVGATRVAIPGLVAALRNPATAAAVRKTLDALGPAARRAMEPVLERLRRRLVALVRQTSRAKSGLSIFFESPVEDDIRQLLPALGPDAAPLLPKLLESHATLDGVFGMPEAFARTGAPGAEAILRVLRDASRQVVRERAADLLSAFTEQAALVVPGLVEAVQGDASAMVRATAVRSLAALAHRQGR